MIFLKISLIAIIVITLAAFVLALYLLVEELVELCRSDTYFFQVNFWPKLQVAIDRASDQVLSDLDAAGDLIGVSANVSTAFQVFLMLVFDRFELRYMYHDTQVKRAEHEGEEGEIVLELTED